MTDTRSTAEILAERRDTHGEYSDHARCTQSIMRSLMSERNWENLPDEMKESLHMFAHKMARVVTGSPCVADHWQDIAGYSTLIVERIERITAVWNTRAFPRSKSHTPEDGGHHELYQESTR